MVSLSCDERELRFAAGGIDNKLRIFDIEMKTSKLSVSSVIS